MRGSLNIAFFGSSLVSAYWNGAATYYRGVVRALHGRGHRVTFYESDAYDRQNHRDIADPDWARVVVYGSQGTEGVYRCLGEAAGADLIIKASGNGVFDTLLEAAVADLKRPSNLVAFWDVDAPATLERLAQDGSDPFGPLIPRYDLILTYGGGKPVVDAYEKLGAQRCVPIYNALDPSTHHPVRPDPRFEADLGFLGNRLPDREARVEEFFLRPAAELQDRRFVIGGNGWDSRPMPSNVRNAGHVYTRDHNAFNCTPRAVLNVNRESMARYGFSPATRVFEAAGAGACLITDAFEGVETFFEPGREILVAHHGGDVIEQIGALTPERARAVGAAARDRALAEHTYDHRIGLLEEVLEVGHRASFSRASAGVDSRLEGSASRAWTKKAFPSGRESTPSGARLNGNVNANANANANMNGATQASPLRIVIIGLTITSSWGNGHATTYRGLVRELAARGHDVLFLEHDKPWYASNRDLPSPPYGRTELYASVEDLRRRFITDVRSADVVIVGSYVPEGIAIGEWVTSVARGLTAFYDIDTPVTLAKLERGDCEYLAPHLILRYDLYLSFTGGPTLERLERDFGAPRALPLYCSVDPSQYFPEPREPDWDLGYLGTYSADRQRPLEALLIEPARRWREGRFCVAGPQYPSDVVWPPNVAHLAHVPPTDHRSFYNRQRFTLNITRADMVRAGYSPSVRLFEAAACGVPILSDWWDGLDSIFTPGDEILISRRPQETLHDLREIDEPTRLQIGRRARERVLAAHTAAHRAAELERYITCGVTACR